MDLTAQILSRCMPRAPRAACETWAPAFDAAAKEFGIDAPHKLAAWLASMANESGQLSRFEELSYFSTPSARIRFVFGAQTPPVETLDQWKAGGKQSFDVAFFNHFYGGKMGSLPGEGFKYRGLGPGQVTGHDNCAAISPVIGVDLVANPDLMRDDPATGARAFAAYFGPINHIADIAADGTEAGFLAAMRAMNSGLAESEFRTHHLARWHEVRIGLGIDKDAKEPVREYQRALLAAGFDPKGIDGVPGRDTIAALHAFQRARNLPVTGAPDEATRAALGVA